MLPHIQPIKILFQKSMAIHCEHLKAYAVLTIIYLE